MGRDEDAMKLVRADLCERIEALQRLPARRPDEFGRSVARFRTIAAAYGFTTAARIAEAMERGLAGGVPAFPASVYFDRLQDAVGCAHEGDEVSSAMLASVSVRLCA